jgi:ankyrin repeat protein
VQLLLDAGADTEDRSEKHRDALRSAVESGHNKVVYTLLNRGARLTTKILFPVLDRNLTDIVALLLPYLTEDMVFERDDNHERTLLHMAAELGYPTLTSRCLDLGAEVDATDKYGKTSLHYAAENGYSDIVKTLIQANADETILDSYERTALDYA